MARLLAIDIGSSSVKAAILDCTRVVGAVARQPFITDFHGERVEVPAERILQAISLAVGELNRKRIDCVAISSMGPSWVAIDRGGRAITPVITHQDRRSLVQARAIEQAIGKSRHLGIVGARPVPGGISSTTTRWFAENAKSTLQRADLLGHLPTLLLRRWCGVRAIDPSQASFTGLYQTIKLGCWDDELIAAARVKRNQLPEISDADRPAGGLRPEGASELGLPVGTPVLPGILDGSVPMLFAGARAGRGVNVCGSTDVLAVCTNRPRPHEKLLTRALGVRGLWLAVSTIAAAGSSIAWARRVFFADYDDRAFDRLLKRLCDSPALNEHQHVRFNPSLGGDRSSVEPKCAGFEGLQLSSGREDLLRAVLISLRDQSAERIRLLRDLKFSMDRRILTTGGGGATAAWMQSAWPGTWRFELSANAAIAGLGALVE